MTNPSQFDGADQERFASDYKDYADTVLQPTRLEIHKALRWDESHRWNQLDDNRMPVASPIYRVRSRIKRPESVLDKIIRHPDSYPKGLAPPTFRRMYDTLGFRIIVYFLQHLGLVHEALLRSGEFEFSEENPPVAYLTEDVKKRINLSVRGTPRESGYASIHYVVRLRESELPYSERPWVEIQLRTIIEDAWAEIHHVLGYKPDKRTSFAVREQFRIIGRGLEAIDHHFGFLADELSRFQREVELNAGTPLNPENLPAVLLEFQITCAQREIDGLLKLLNSRGVSTIGSLRELAVDDRIRVIRQVFADVLGRGPGAFELVANLANLIGIPIGDRSEQDRVRTQINISRISREIRELED